MVHFLCALLITVVGPVSIVLLSSAYCYIMCIVVLCVYCCPIYFSCRIADFRCRITGFVAGLLAFVAGLLAFLPDCWFRYRVSGGAVG